MLRFSKTDWSRGQPAGDLMPWWVAGPWVAGRGLTLLRQSHFLFGAETHTCENPASCPWGKPVEASGGCPAWLQSEATCPACAGAGRCCPVQALPGRSVSCGAASRDTLQGCPRSSQNASGGQHGFRVVTQGQGQILESRCAVMFSSRCKESQCF